MAKKQRVSVVGTVLTVEYPTIRKSFVVDYADYPEEILDCALAHGFKQKFGDAASGKSADEKYAEVQKIHEALLAGEWERTASPDNTGVVIEAVSRIKGLDLEKVKAAVEKDPEVVKTWRDNAKVKKVIAEIYAERAAERAEGAEDPEIEID